MQVSALAEAAVVEGEDIDAQRMQILKLGDDGREGTLTVTQEEDRVAEYCALLPAGILNRRVAFASFGSRLDFLDRGQPEALSVCEDER